MDSLVVSGKRKTAIAKAHIKPGTGKVFYNNKSLSFFNELMQLPLSEPLYIANEVLGHTNFDIRLNVRGGGNSSQIGAARLAIAKAIIAFTKSDKLRSAYLAYDRNMLVADTRRKETRKPGDSKARARMQTSYR